MVPLRQPLLQPLYFGGFGLRGSRSGAPAAAVFSVLAARGPRRGQGAGAREVEARLEDAPRGQDRPRVAEAAGLFLGYGRRVTPRGRR